MKNYIHIFLLFIFASSLVGCSDAGQKKIIPTTSPIASITYTPAKMPTTAIRTPNVSFSVDPDSVDPEIVDYLDGAETLLSHSSTIIFDQAQSFADVCPGWYITAFPFRTSRTDRISLVIAFVSLPRQTDGMVIEGAHKLLWTWRQEGIEPFELDKVEWLSRDEKWPLTLRFLVFFAGKWLVGITSGTCPGDDIHLVGLFGLDHPENFSLEITRFSEGDPFDFWLQDGEQLTHYRWEPWDAISISSLNHTPGKLVGVTWTDASPDLNGNGVPDVSIQWKIDDEIVERFYSEDVKEIHEIN